MRRSPGQVARRRGDPSQASLVEPSHDDPRTMVRAPRSNRRADVRRGRDLVGWTLPPRCYQIVAWRGPPGDRQHRSQRAATLGQARLVAWDAVRLDGWDGAWIFPSET